MTAQILTSALRDFLARNDTGSIAAAFRSQHAADIAARLSELSASEAARVLLVLAEPQGAAVFGYLESNMQIEIAEILNRADLARLMTAMSHDERADLFKRLPQEAQEALLPGLAHAEREDIRKLAAYDEGTAGALMTSDYVTLPFGLSVREAIDRLRHEAPDKETIYDAYVVDDGRRLVGVLSLRDLLIAKDTALIGDIMRREVISVRAQDPQEMVADRIAQYDLLALPVIDGADALVGIVTVDDVIDLLGLEKGKRLVRFGGVSTLSGPDIDLKASSFGYIFKARFFWLALLTLFGVVTSTFVAAQQELLEKAIILAAFVAPIVDMGGNTGSQTATLVIRAMALGQVKIRRSDLWFVLRRDIPVALALGVCIALLEAVLAYVSKGVGLDVLLVVGLSMLACTVVGSLVGLFLPFAARLLKQDPATLSSPVITSIMDFVGVLIYFGLAYVFLGHLLLAD